MNFQIFTNTDWIALYAAMVATATFIWQVFKWCSDKPKLKIEVKPNFIFNKLVGMLSLDQKGDYSHKEKGIAIKIANIGNIPTTLEFIAIQPYKKTFFRKIRHSECFTLSFSSPLPTILRTGELWSGFYVDQTKLVEMCAEYDFVVEFHHSFVKKPTTVKLNFQNI